MVSDDAQAEVMEFVYREARLADEARYAEWLALWTADGVYWVPATTDPAARPDTHLSHIYDNRARIETRIKLLQTAIATARSPPRSCAGSSPIWKWREPRTASSWPSRTSSWPSCPSSHATRCTGGWGGRPIACVVSTAS